MKKVILFTGNFLPRIGGAEMAIYHLANGLASRGYDVLVLCGGKRKDNIIVKEKYSVNFRIVRYPYSFRLSGLLRLNMIFSALYLLYFFTVEKYRVIHAHFTFHPGYTCALLKKFIPIKYIVTPHGSDIQKIPEINYGIRLNRHIEKKVYYALKKADYITSLSNSILYELEKIPNLNMKNIVNIPNGFDQDKYTGEIIYNIRKIFNLPSDSIVLISVGRNHFVKNFKYSLNAVMNLRDICDLKTWESVYYVIIGEGATNCRDLVNKLGLADSVILSESVMGRKLADCYRTSDIFLNPSITESFGMVNVEAMSAGLPLIVSNVPGNRDIVNNKVGYLVDINDPKQMADKILHLLEKQDERLRLSKNAVEESKKYHWDKIVDKYIEAYEALEKDTNLNRGSICK